MIRPPHQGAPKKTDAASRVSTGVAGLDDKMEGGFFAGSVNLISGKTGTGKTGFCASFLYDGAHRGEPGFYLTTEESEDDIKNDVKAMFGWDLDGMEKAGKLSFHAIRPTISADAISAEDLNRAAKLYTSNLLETIEEGIRKVRARRVVVDSISLIEMFIKDDYLARAVLMLLIERLKALGVTALFTGTVPESMQSLSGGEIVEYLVDSVIKLDFTPVARDFKRTLTIRKMRRTDHSVFIHPFAIERDGMRVLEVG